MLSRIFAGTFAEFRPLPWTRAENLSRDLVSQDFDVLHITAHGEGEFLQVLYEQNTPVPMSAERIISFLPPQGGPRLVYLNACDSEQVAQRLIQRVPFAVGSTLPLSNDQAIHGAIAFYWRVLLGSTVHDAFEAAKNMVGMLSIDRASMCLHEKAGFDASKSILLPEPKIVAAFARGLPSEPKNFYEVLFGVEGTPRGTTQVVFFTDDEDLISDDDDEGSLAEDLCMVARGAPNEDGSLWCDRAESWDVSGNFNLYAIGVTAEGRRWTAAGTLSDALERWHTREFSGRTRRAMQRSLAEVLQALRGWRRPQFRPTSRRPIAR
jgi:hypothetical protein